MPRDVGAFLLAAQQAEKNQEIAQTWAKLEELYNKKLWHQLTLLVQEFVKNPKFQDASLLPMYENFIAEFENKINPLSLVEIIAYVVKHIKDTNQAVEFLHKTQEKVKASTEAVILCKTLTGQLKLSLVPVEQQNLEDAKKVIEEAEELLETLDGVTTVHGRFYELSSNYYRLVGKHAEYYKDALRYLGCSELGSISRTEQAERAFFLGLAALLGEGVYNFGELLAHPILDSLKGTSNEWLVQFLYTFNSGNLDQYEKLRPFWSKQPDLQANELGLRQKISLLCLMEILLVRCSTDTWLCRFDKYSYFKIFADAVPIPVLNVDADTPEVTTGAKPMLHVLIQILNKIT